MLLVLYDFVVIPLRVFKLEDSTFMNVIFTLGVAYWTMLYCFFWFLGAVCFFDSFHFFFVFLGVFFCLVLDHVWCRWLPLGIFLGPL